MEAFDHSPQEAGSMFILDGISRCAGCVHLGTLPLSFQHHYLLEPVRVISLNTAASAYPKLSGTSSSVVS